MTRAPWYLAGPLLGLSIVALRAALNKPLGVLGGYIDCADGITRSKPVGTGAWLLLGFVIGGSLYAATTGTFSISFGYPSALRPTASPWLQAVVLMGAGIAMGIGARTAGGCTSGHGLSGTSHGSPGSFVAAATFFTGGVLLTHALFGRF